MSVAKEAQTCARVAEMDVTRIHFPYFEAIRHPIFRCIGFCVEQPVKAPTRLVIRYR